MGYVEDLPRLDNVVRGQLLIWVGVNQFVPAVAVAREVLGYIPETIALFDGDGHALIIAGLDPAEPVEKVSKHSHHAASFFDLVVRDSARS
jgi:hypothetical protein